jgi:Uncharacterized conserved protein (COG2071)
MRVSKVHGTIKRRLLINFHVDPGVMQRQLPSPFRPKLHDGHAVAGICLIRLENIRPRRFPSLLGLSSENAAHRVAVIWEDEAGRHEGVYIPRRDTGSLVNHLAGGRLFPGEHQRARFDIAENGSEIALKMRSADGRIEIDVAGCESDRLPQTSIFRCVGDASAFFESGSLGYSPTAAGRRLDGITLTTDSWRVAPLAMDRIHSSYFEDPSLFPKGSIGFDCALLMRNIPHVWEVAADMYVSTR